MEYNITGDEFHEILERFIEEKISLARLLSIPEIYEVLSEKYNNEVLNMWEQGKDQKGQKEKEKLFAFDLHELDGERERDVPRLVKAKDIEEAEKKTRHYAARWYPFDTTYQYNKFEMIHIFDAGTIYITVKNLQEIEKRDWVQMMFRAALIG